MNKRFFISLVCMTLLWGCSSGTATNPNGTYSFDSEAWKASMNAIDPNFSKASAELVDKMLTTFNSFNMVVKDKEITANFGETTMAGTLSEVSKDDKGTTYKMTPLNAAQQKQIILVTINGSTMVAGPEGDKRQLMFFKKNESK